MAIRISIKTEVVFMVIFSLRELLKKVSKKSPDFVRAFSIRSWVVYLFSNILPLYRVELNIIL